MNFDISWWITFNMALIGLIAYDLSCLRKRGGILSVSQSLRATGGWIAIAIFFAALLFFTKGSKIALEFTTGYLIEKSLSIDNLFVFMMIFRYFAVPAKIQKTILIWGILGALIMRFIFIFAGIALIQQFHWIIYLFGAFLIVAGAMMFSKTESKYDPESNVLFKLAKKIIPFKRGWHTDAFFVKEGGKTYGTEALLVLLAIESTDLLFALDSIPAVFAITLDPFIVYSCNALAILGLRSLYFVLHNLLEVFHYLHYAVCIILMFVGTKMLLSTLYPIPTGISLGVVASLIVISLLVPHKGKSS